MRRALAAPLLTIAAPLVCEAAALLRSLLFARLLGPDALGQAMVLAMTLRGIEMATDLSPAHFMAHARDGGGLALQRGLHGLSLVRGALAALILAGLAAPLSALFGGGAVPPSAFAALALVPLLRGAVHLDHRRFERGFHYRASVTVEAGSAFAMLVATPAAAAMLPDHRALLPILIVQALSAVVLSHTVARRRYRLALRPALVRRVVGFGAPLIVNATLLFLIVNGDRLIVAGFYDFATLGMFGVCAQLAILPALVLGRSGAALLLPAFRRAAAGGALGEALVSASTVFAAAAMAFFAGFALLARPCIAVLYGDAFIPSQELVLALGAAAAVRIARTPLSQLAVALGRTDLPARANLWRAFAVGGAALAALLGAPITVVAAVGVLGEIAAAVRMLPFAAVNLGGAPDHPVNLGVRT